ncbi:hypothetical protein ABL78_7540 [Leptomonas seymouri]|uniref:C2H2-type domain-containing protein n=1 Tax=Leptomonas seymouri TaxID=5684 RepID=A0A0N1HS86_LEPSE|nr:hypothetical protein ABL78_7540 [Leptomonas seymouri]|eukprot:KPI83423.1 hypothetical protein ABL78_7540 [Leptomonas seymouri]
MSCQSAFRIQRLRLAPLRCLCLTATSLWRSPRLSCELHRASGGIRAAAAANHLSLRLCQTRSTPSTTHAASAGSVAASTSPTPIRDRFVCPECGKHFLCSANLLRHRSARHGLHVVTPQEAARAELVAKNAELQQELTRLRARVQQLKEEAPSARTASCTAPDSAATSAMTRAYPSAVPTGQLMDVDEGLAREWQRSGVALGTGISFAHCVGTVRGPVQLGTLAGAPPETAPRVVQFMLETHGYRERRPGQLMMYRAHTPVRYIPSQPYHNEGSLRATDRAAALFSVCEGDVVCVQGHYGLHNSYDMVSKRPVENAVIEADVVGLLRRAGAAESAAAAVTETEARSATAFAAPCAETSSQGEPVEAMRRPAPSFGPEAALPHAPPGPLNSAPASTTKRGVGGREGARLQGRKTRSRRRRTRGGPLPPPSSPTSCYR